ncbi:MAG: folate-binding protein [Pseudomonadota bacterium]
MSDTGLIMLGDRAVLEVGGADAASFLSGMLTNVLPVASAANDVPVAPLAGLLTPQGKIIAEALLVPLADGGFLLDTPAATLDELHKRLTMYRLRAAVTITKRPDLHVAWSAAGNDAAAAGAAQGVVAAYSDGRTGLAPQAGAALDGFRVIAEGGSAVLQASGDSAPGEGGALGAQAHLEQRVSAGIAECGIDFPGTSLFPHDVCWDLVGGVSFSKGCYVGQEVVSRMKHKTDVRRRVACLAGSGSVPAMGDDVRAGEALLGHVGAPVQEGEAGWRALAVLRLDKLARAVSAGQAVTCETAEVSVTAPQGAPYAVGAVEHA